MYFLSIINKMQNYTGFFIIANALHVSGGFSTHHQQLKKLSSNSPTLAVAASKLDIYPMLCVQFFELLMMGGKNRLKHVEH
jgi:hypothetical protein